MRGSIFFGCLVMLCMTLFFTSPGVTQAQTPPTKAQIDHGEYIVRVGGCADCHAPKVMTPNGPAPHPTKGLSGQQADSKLPAIPKDVLGPDKWTAMTNSDFTAWVGPWGVSFAANITPDPATGIGGWTEDMFIKTLRTGKHMGTGRNLLPPMPWPTIGQMTDRDLKDVFAYLKSTKPIANRRTGSHSAPKEVGIVVSVKEALLTEKFSSRRIRRAHVSRGLYLFHARVLPAPIFPGAGVLSNQRSVIRESSNKKLVRTENERRASMTSWMPAR